MPTCFQTTGLLRVGRIKCSASALVRSPLPRLTGSYIDIFKLLVVVVVVVVDLVVVLVLVVVVVVVVLFCNADTAIFPPQRNL